MNSNTSQPASRPRLILGGVLILLGVGLVIFNSRQGKNHARGDDELVRLGNVGKSQYEKGEGAAAAVTFQKALALQPAHTNTLLNLANALLLADRADEVIPQAQAILARDPDSAAAYYLIGCAHLRRARFAEAVKSLSAAKTIDQTINAVSFQLGLAHEGLAHYDDALTQWREVVEFEPEHPAVHYRLSQLLNRTGKKDEAAKEFELHRQITAKLSAPPAGPAAFESCKHTQIRLSFKFEEPDQAGVKVTFTDATDAAFPSGGAAKFQGPAGVIDFTRDGRNHLLVAEGTNGFRLLANAHGVFTPKGDLRPALAGARYTRCLVGDLNNDGVPDAFMLSDRGVQLFKFATNGTFSDIAPFAGLTNVSAADGALIDLDFHTHLDLLVLTPDGRGTRLLRNLGDMYFTDRTATSGLPAKAESPLLQVALEDWNGDDVLDVFLTRAGRPPQLLVKQRGGPLLATNPAAWPVGGVITLGDVNNDSRPDLFIATADKIEIVFGDSSQRLSLPLGGFPPRQLRLLDYDNDGWLDLLALGDGLRVWRNLGRAGFLEVTAALGLDQLAGKKIEHLSAADFDNDGDIDLLVSVAGEGLRLFRNDGGNANHLLKLRLVGTRSNASGLGIRLDVTAGGLRLTRRVGALPVEIGVGKHDRVDALKARWLDLSPGYEDIPVDPRTPLTLLELGIKPGSCPYVYAWDGQRFRFVSDILGSAPLGLPFAEHRYIAADEDELVRLGDEKNFQPRDGKYLVQITEELREVLYLDTAQLVVVDHPAGTEVHTTDKLRPAKPPGGFPRGELLTLHRRQPLQKAARQDGLDVAAALAEHDGELASPALLFEPQLTGWAGPWQFTFDFGALAADRSLVLALTGWIRFGGGMANIASSERRNLSFPFPVLEVETAAGAWQPVDVTVGAPSGKTKTILVDLAGKLPPGSRRLRLGGSFEIHWDRAALFERLSGAAVPAVFTGVSPVKQFPEISGETPRNKGGTPAPLAEAATRTTLYTLAPAVADLHWRGFSELIDPPWNRPFTPDYGRVKSTPPWTITPSGWVTRHGDVRELLDGRDNALVLVNSGDELTLAFPAAGLPPKPEGYTRDFFLLTSGWDKDADFHVATGTTVEPLPWHGLDDQRYGTQPRPAFTNDAWMQKFNTRWAGPHPLVRKN